MSILKPLTVLIKGNLFCIQFHWIFANTKIDFNSKRLILESYADFSSSSPSSRLNLDSKFLTLVFLFSRAMIFFFFIRATIKGNKYIIILRYIAHYTSPPIFITPVIQITALYNNFSRYNFILFTRTALNVSINPS